MSTENLKKKKERHVSEHSTVSTDSVGKYIPTPPDGGWGWVIVLASFINHVIVDGIAFTFGVFYIEFVDYFKASKAKTAMVGSLLCGMYLSTGPIAGALTNKFGCRPVCIAGGIIASGAFVLSTWAPNIDVLMLTYGVLGGIGFGLIYLPSVISVSYYFEKRRALATGIAVCGAGVGCFIFAPAGRVLLDTFDWQNALLIIAAVVLNSCVCGMLFRRLESPHRKKKPRAKNVLDRLRESAQAKLARVRTHSEKESNHSPATERPRPSVIEKVQEAKLARQEALRDDESESSSLHSIAWHSVRKLDSSPSSRNGSIVMSRHNSKVGAREITIPEVPQIVVQTASCQDINENTNEKSRMLTYEDEVASSVKLDEEKMDSVPVDSSGYLSSNISLPNGNANYEKKGDSSLLRPHGFLLPEHDDRSRSRSVNDVWLKIKELKKPRKPQKIQKADYARPMYRKDIFYSGSIMHIPQFRSQPNIQNYVASITTIPDELPPEEESTFWKYCCISKSVKDALQEMLDLSIFKNPVFLINCICNIFGMIGLYVPFVYIAQRAIELGVPGQNAAFLLSVIGITNTLGRVLMGWLADFPQVSPLLLHNIAIIAGGVSCMLISFFTSYASLCAFAAFFGLCVATWISLTSIILCNMIGLEKLTNAFGLLTLARGIASIIGPPIAGAVYDATNNYNSSFYIGGAMLIAAGGLHCLLHLPCFKTESFGNQMIPTPEELLGPDEDVFGPDKTEVDATVSVV